MFGVLAEGQAHALVKDIALAFPKTLVAEGLAIFDDAAVQVVDLLKALVLHISAQIFAADIAGTIGQDRLILG